METPECVFASAHLDFTSVNVEQAAVINDWFIEHYSGYDKPVFLCGDMNSLPSGDAVQELEQFWTRLSPVDDTFIGGKCIDFIFSFDEAAPADVVSAAVIYEDTGDLSDHYPVVVTVR